MEIAFVLKFFGILYALVGLAMLLNPDDARRMVSTLADAERPDRLRLVSFIPLLFGLWVVLGYNAWDTVPHAVLSLFGWAAILKGGFYLLAPVEPSHKLMRLVNQARTYTVGGWFALIAGLYLAGAGFGLY